MNDEIDSVSEGINNGQNRKRASLLRTLTGLLITIAAGAVIGTLFWFMISTLTLGGIKEYADIPQNTPPAKSLWPTLQLYLSIMLPLSLLIWSPRRVAQLILNTSLAGHSVGKPVKVLFYVVSYGALLIYPVNNMGNLLFRPIKEQLLSGKEYENRGSGPMRLLYGFAFSDDLNHVIFAERTDGKALVYIDDKPAIQYDKVKEKTPSISSDGRHVSYVALIDGHWSVVFDGESGPGYREIDELRMSSDGKHLAYSVLEDDEWKVIVDDKPGRGFIRTEHIQMSSDGSNVAYAAKQGRLWKVVFNDESSPEYREIGKIAISSDGSVLAYSALEDQKWRVITNGTPGKAYDKVQDLCISPDGSHVAYMALTEDSWSMVLDGRERDTVPNFVEGTLEPGPEGECVAFCIRKQDQLQVVMDCTGTDQDFLGVQHDKIVDIAISPDGIRLAYLALEDGILTLVKDGQAFRFPKGFSMVIRGSTMLNSEGTLTFLCLKKSGLMKIEYEG